MDDEEQEAEEFIVGLSWFFWAEDFQGIITEQVRQKEVRSQVSGNDHREMVIHYQRCKEGREAFVQYPDGHCSWVPLYGALFNQPPMEWRLPLFVIESWLVQSAAPQN